jgi:epoxyqueuosine reductase
MMHLGELFISEDVDGYDTPMTGVGCGTCRRCVEACPNGAISDDRTINTHRCISCRTIERESSETPITLDGWIYGCDACQSVCPFNLHAPEHRNPLFDPLFDPTALDAAAWLAMSDAEFEAMAGTTAMPRAGLERIKGNIMFPMSNE